MKLDDCQVILALKLIVFVILIRERVRMASCYT